MRLNLCTPAIVYLVLALLGTIGEIIGKNKKTNAFGLIINILVIGIITYGLNYICNKYSVRYSWYTLAVLILLPLLLALTFGIASVIIR